MARKTRLTKPQLEKLKRVSIARKKIPSNKQLAVKMGVSERTIENYISRFMWRSTGKDIIMNESAMSDDMGLDKKRLRQLVQLCHPDKHSNSVTANDVTQWLMSRRDK